MDGKNEQRPPPEMTASCWTAVAAYEKEDYRGALEAIKNCTSDETNPVFYHHAEAFLHYKIAMKNEDAMTVSYHKKEAAISACRAADLCRNSLRLAHFSASMLYILACLNNGHRDYERVIQECERALAIKDPEEPDGDSFIFKDLSQEMEIGKITRELKGMINQCRNKKGGVPFGSKKRFGEDIQEIGKRVKYTEERRQKQTFDNLLANLGEQLKVKSFWGNMCSEDKRKLFEVSTEDFKTHLCLLKDPMVVDHVLEAVEFCKTQKPWKFWQCLYCSDKFCDGKSYMDHLSDNHGWAIAYHAISFLPAQVDDASDSFGSGEHPWIVNFMDEQLCNDWDSDIKENVILSGDFLCLLLGQQLLPGEFNLANYFDSVASNAGSDKILSLLYTGQEVLKELERWTKIMGHQKRLSKEICAMFESKRLNLVEMCEERVEHGKEMRAIKKVQRICVEENERREKHPQYMVQTYASLLRKLQTEIEESTANAEDVHKYDLDFISYILEEEKIVTAYQPEIKPNMQEDLNLSDECLRKKISWCKDQLSRIINAENEIIKRNLAVIEQVGLQYAMVSACDYGFIMVLILKSLIQSRLENLVLKENKEYSDANTHALLKELDAKTKINEQYEEEKNKGKKYDIQVKEFKGTERGKKPWLPWDEAEPSDFPFLDINVQIAAEQQELEEFDKIFRHQMQSLDAMHGSNSPGPGLENEYADNNCFLNVIIQSLWHLRAFHDRFISSSKHEHVDPCFVCALRDMFENLCKASKSNQKYVSPLPLREALSHLHKNEANNIKRFQMGQQNDALEALQAILEHLKGSFSSGWGSLDSASRTDCGDLSNLCLVDEVFGMKFIVQSNNVPTRITKWSISHTLRITVEDLQNSKIAHGNCSFGELVKRKLEETVKNELEETALDVSSWLPPDIILIGCIILENKEISEYLNSLSTTLTVSLQSQGKDTRNKYILFSLVCFHPIGLHYTCIISDHERERCVWYNDEVVKDIGSWDNAFKKCIEDEMQPHILLFEKKNLEEPSYKDTAPKFDAEIEYLEYHGQNKNEANGECTAESNGNIVKSLGENEGVSAINSSGHEDNNDKVLQADIRKALHLSFAPESFERQTGTLPADAKDGTTLL